MIYTAYSLNGTWEMNYAEEAYTGTQNPWNDKSLAADELYSGTEKGWDQGFFVSDCVPGYWEDMTEKFAMQTPWFLNLRVNPEYGLQRYPLVGYAPDMALPNVMGNFFYRRSFLWNKEAKPVVIHFGGVQNAVSVWLNDVFLGRHEGYSTPFELPIPEEILQNGENIIVLSVSNIGLTGYDGQPVSGLTNRAANQYTGGITGNVELWVYESPLRDAVVTISRDCSRVEVALEAVGSAAVTWAVLDGESVLLTGKGQDVFSFGTEGLPRWSPEDPHCLILQITCGEAVLHRTFGIRRLITEGNRFRFNGRPCYLRGICEHGYFPETVHPAEDPRFYRRVIRTIKELGFNFIRFHTFIPAEAYMQAADELGVLLQVECPNNTSLEADCGLLPPPSFRGDLLLRKRTADGRSFYCPPEAVRGSSARGNRCPVCSHERPAGSGLPLDRTGAAGTAAPYTHYPPSQTHPGGQQLQRFAEYRRPLPTEL